MNERTRPDRTELPLDVLDQIDRLCDQYEAAWAGEARPQVQDYLGPVAEGYRPALLRDLIAVELNARRRRGESPEPQEYQAHFPDFDLSIAAAFALAEVQSVDTPSTVSQADSDRKARPAAHAPPEVLDRTLPEAIGAAGATGVLPAGPGLPEPTLVWAGSGGAPGDFGRDPAVPGDDHAEGLPTPPGLRGRFFGDYEVQELLGRGGMGVVYKARQLSLDRTVALKMIHSGLWASTDEVERFRNEAQAIAELDHPGIITIHEVGRFQCEHYFSMKLVQGPNLAKVLADYAADPRAAARLVAEIARAVHHAHQRGILHRDLKPSNILIDAEGHPHVADFGLAKRASGAGEQTVSGPLVGTPQYMSPEQTSAHRSGITTATDVYGLGAILYAATTGRPPFQGESLVEILDQVRDRTPRPPSQQNPRIDLDLETICLKCLEKDPRRRYGSAEALADDLERWLRGEPILARRTGTWERAAKWARRHPAATALAVTSVVALLTIVGLGVALAFHSRLQRAFAEVDLQRGIAETALDHERMFLYTNRVIFAQRELFDHNPHRALELLEQCPADRRDWEWHYLKRQCRTELCSLTGHGGTISDVAFSRDGRRIISAGADQTVRLWDSTSGRLLRTWDGYRNVVHGVSLSPEGDRFATASGSPSEPDPALIRDIESGRILLSIDARTGLNSGVAFSHDGRLIVIAGGDLPDGQSSVQIYDAATGKEIRTIAKVDQPTYHPSFSPDGTRVIATVGGASSADPMDKINRVVVWDVETGRERVSLRGSRAPVIKAVFSPDGKTIASGGYDAMVRLWDTETGRLRQELVGHQNCVNDVAFSPDGTRLASASDDNTVILWDVLTAKSLLTLSGHRGGIFGLAFHPDGGRLATCGYDGQIKLWDAITPKESRALSPPAPPGRISALAFNNSGEVLASACADHTVKLWEMPRGRLKATLTGHHQPVWGVAFSPDERWIASAAGDWRRTDRSAEVHLWDSRTGRLVYVLKDHHGIAWTVAFSPDSSRLASGGGEIHAHDDEIVISDVVSGRRLRKIPCPEGGIKQVAFSPDGRALAAAAGNVARTWNVETGRPLVTFAGHQNLVHHVAYTADGGRLATASHDLTIRVWNAATGEEMHRLLGHGFEVDGLAFSPNDRRIASVGGDKTLKIWDAESGQELLTLRGHDGYVWAVTFSPDGHRIATGDDQGIIKLWDGTP